MAAPARSPFARLIALAPAVVLAAACAQVYESPGLPPDEDSIARASAVLEDSAHLVQVLDRGTLVFPEAYFYVTRWERRLITDLNSLGAPVIEELRPVRVLRGPRKVHVPIRRIDSVRARTGPWFANVEIELDVPVPGARGPAENTLLIMAREAERAHALVDALDLARRAAEESEPVGPAAP